MAKSHFWPISPLYLECKTSNWQHEPIYGSIMLNIVLWASLTFPHQFKKKRKITHNKILPLPITHFCEILIFFLIFANFPMSCVCPIPYRSPQARQPLPVALIVLPEPEHRGSSTLPTKLGTSSTTLISEVQNNQTSHVRQARQPNCISPQQHHPVQHVQPLRQLVLAQRDLR